MTSTEINNLNKTPESLGKKLSKKHPERYAPKNGWKEKTWYLVEVAFCNNNPVHRQVFYSGFISKDMPCGYSGFVSTDSETTSYYEAVYFKPVEVLFTDASKKL